MFPVSHLHSSMIYIAGIALINKLLRFVSDWKTWCGGEGLWHIIWELQFLPRKATENKGSQYFRMCLGCGAGNKCIRITSTHSQQNSWKYRLDRKPANYYSIMIFLYSPLLRFRISSNMGNIIVWICKDLRVFIIWEKARLLKYRDPII